MTMELERSDDPSHDLIIMMMMMTKTRMMMMMIYETILSRIKLLNFMSFSSVLNFNRLCSYKYTVVAKILIHRTRNYFPCASLIAQHNKK
jgi:hypothetical protein